MSDLRQFAQNLTDFLEYKKEEGFQTLEISPETLAEIRSQGSGVRGQKERKEGSREKEGSVPYSSNYEITKMAPKSIETPKSTVRVSGKTLDEIAGQIRTCSACPLHQSRTKTVPGEGNPNRPDILFIGDAPGPEEDQEGRFFVSEAGRLLDKMIVAMGYKREEIFITNMVKCRPPEMRIPLTEEMITCLPYLKAQIALIQPKLIVALGKTAVEGLLNEKVAITRMRGTWKMYESIDLMPTFHPAYLLRSPGKKGEVWADLKAVLARLGKQPPAKKQD
jgi:DNA polymerase